MRGWAGRTLGGASPAGRTGGASEVEVVGVEGRCLIEESGEEVALRWPAGGREGRGLVGEVEVEEDGGDDGRIGEEREDPHLSAAGGTEQRQHIVDASEQDGPADPRGRGRRGGGSADGLGEGASPSVAGASDTSSIVNPEARPRT